MKPAIVVLLNINRILCFCLPLSALAFLCTSGNTGEIIDLFDYRNPPAQKSPTSSSADEHPNAEVIVFAPRQIPSFSEETQSSEEVRSAIASANQLRDSSRNIDSMVWSYTQGEVSLLIYNASVAEANMSYFSDEARFTPNSGEADLAIAAYREALDAFESNRVVEKLNARGFDTHRLPSMQLMKPAPEDIRNQIIQVRVSLIALNLRNELRLIEMKQQPRRVMWGDLAGLPTVAQKDQLDTLLETLRFATAALSSIRNRMIGDRFDLERIDKLMDEIEYAFTSGAIANILRTHKRSWRADDRKKAQEIEVGWGRAASLISFIRNRGTLKSDLVSVSNARRCKNYLERLLSKFE